MKPKCFSFYNEYRQFFLAGHDYFEPEEARYFALIASYQVSHFIQSNLTNSETMEVLVRNQLYNSVKL